MGYIAYYRVSTTKQGESGLGLEGQKEAVSRFLKDKSEPLIASYTEVESGTKVQRPKLDLAVEHAKRTKSVLVIAKLDRLYRSVYGISSLMNSGVEFVACDMPLADKFSIHIFAAVAEWKLQDIRPYQSRISRKTGKG